MAEVNHRVLLCGYIDQAETLDEDRIQKLDDPESQYHFAREIYLPFAPRKGLKLLGLFDLIEEPSGGMEGIVTVVREVTWIVTQNRWLAHCDVRLFLAPGATVLELEESYPGWKWSVIDDSCIDEDGRLVRVKQH